MPVNLTQAAIPSDKLRLANATSCQRLPYHKPVTYFLGSLEQVQANYGGTYYDGPTAWYYYDN